MQPGVSVHILKKGTFYPCRRANLAAETGPKNFLPGLLSPILPGIPPVPVHRLPTVHLRQTYLDSNPVSDNCSNRNDLPEILQDLQNDGAVDAVGGIDVPDQRIFLIAVQNPFHQTV